MEMLSLKESEETWQLNVTPDPKLFPVLEEKK